MDYKTQYQMYLSQASAALEDACAKFLPEESEVCRAARYSLLGGGKRIRAVLVLSVCDMLGGDPQTARAFSAAVEMLHCYSLIHDDLPCMDNDDLRRGQLTNHRKFGEDVAILAGDGLLSAAMELMARQAAKLAKAGDCAGVLAMEAIARHAGVTGMVAGQTMDVTGEGTRPTADKVRYIHLHKTADLLTAPLTAGLMLAGADEAQLELGRRYGRGLGLAFQIEDDLNALFHGRLQKAAGVDQHNVGVFGAADEMESRRLEDAAEMFAVDGVFRAAEADDVEVLHRVIFSLSGWSRRGGIQGAARRCREN
mgnify:CR=1 FL=1